MGVHVAKMKNMEDSNNKQHGNYCSNEPADFLYIIQFVLYLSEKQKIRNYIWRISHEKQGVVFRFLQKIVNGYDGA